MLTKSVITGLEDEINFEENSKIYPNPNTINGILNFDSEFTGKISLTNLQGQLIYNDQLNKSRQIELQKMNLSPGIYFLNMSGNLQTTEKIIIY